MATTPMMMPSASTTSTSTISSSTMAKATTTTMPPPHAPSLSPTLSSAGAASPSTGGASSSSLVLEPTSPSSLSAPLELGSDGLPRGVEVVRWEEERVLVFQMAVAGEVVARRVDNGFVNGTKLLNLAILTRGRRDSQLKNVKDRQVVLKGPRNLKGVWIPLAVAQQLASRFNLLPRLGALLSNSLRCPAQSPDVPPPRPARASCPSLPTSSAVAVNSSLAARRGARPPMAPMRKTVGGLGIGIPGLTGANARAFGFGHGPLTAPASTDSGPSSHHPLAFPWMTSSAMSSPSTTSTPSASSSPADAMRSAAAAAAMVAAAAAFNSPDTPSTAFSTSSSPHLPTPGAGHYLGGGYVPVSYPPLLGYAATPTTPMYPYPTTAAHSGSASVPPSSSPYAAALGHEFEAAIQRGWAATSPFAAGLPMSGPAGASLSVSVSPTSTNTSTSSCSRSSATSVASPHDLVSHDTLWTTWASAPRLPAPQGGDCGNGAVELVEESRATSCPMSPPSATALTSWAGAMPPQSTTTGFHANASQLIMHHPIPSQPHHPNHHALSSSSSSGSPYFASTSMSASSSSSTPSSLPSPTTSHGLVFTTGSGVNGPNAGDVGMLANPYMPATTYRTIPSSLSANPNVAMTMTKSPLFSSSRSGAGELAGVRGDDVSSSSASSCVLEEDYQQHGLGVMAMANANDDVRKLYLTPAPSPFIPCGFDPITSSNHDMSSSSSSASVSMTTS